MKYGRDKDATCPAYPDYGHLCWPVAGTKCKERVHGTHARKIDNSESCEFFCAVVFAGLNHPD